jgi:hypothetical protein
MLIDLFPLYHKLHLLHPRSHIHVTIASWQGRKFREHSQTRSWGTGDLLTDRLAGNRCCNFTQNCPQNAPFEIVFSSGPKLGMHMRAPNYSLLNTDYISLYHSEFPCAVNQSVNHQKPLLSATKPSPPFYKYPSKPRHQCLWTIGDALNPLYRACSPLSFGSVLYCFFIFNLLSLSIELCWCFAICVSSLNSLFRTPRTWDLLHQCLLRPPSGNIGSPGWVKNELTNPIPSTAWEELILTLKQ